jgi:hypothetical protein
MQHKYRVYGDFNLMIHWGEYFGGGRASGKSVGNVSAPHAIHTQNNPELAVPAKRSLLFCILPFAVFWTVINLLPEFGVYIAIIVAASVPLFSHSFALTVYDTTTSFSVVALSIASLYLPLHFVLAISYGIFAAMGIFTVWFQRWYPAYYARKTI